MTGLSGWRAAKGKREGVLRMRDTGVGSRIRSEAACFGDGREGVVRDNRWQTGGQGDERVWLDHQSLSGYGREQARVVKEGGVGQSQSVAALMGVGFIGGQMHDELKEERGEERDRNQRIQRPYLRAMAARSRRRLRNGRRRRARSSPI
jgi:hypothetical protein